MNYTSNIQHRNGNPEKSQWTISTVYEESSFQLSIHNNWLLNTHGWGLHLVSGQPTIVGIAKDRTNNVFFAKFVGADKINWHGYPADYRNNNHDIPDSDILRKWLDASIFSRATIRKITKGQKCNL